MIPIDNMDVLWPRCISMTVTETYSWTTWEYDLDVLVLIQSVQCQTILSLLLLQMKTRTFMLPIADGRDVMHNTRLERNAH